MQDDVYKLLEKAGHRHIAEYRLTYDSPFQQLEPVYYWLLDYMRDLGFETEKLVDSFAASPGSGYFAEIGKRASIMQEQAMKYLGTINTVIKSIINLIWDLKEFEIRLKLYDGLKSKNEKERIAALNALKEIWITNVDIKKGRGAINMLTTQLEFVTLRDAFFIVKRLEDIDKLDLNERVKNILRSRLIEFNDWLEKSEIEIRNRYKIEKTYLKSQVASLKLYARWARPYLRAAEQLMMKETKEAALVTAFSTAIFELLLLCKKKYTTEIPEFPKTIKAKAARPFYGLIFIDLSFRSIPTPAGREGGYVFGGRVDIGFRSYVLREDEFQDFMKEFEKNEFETTISLTQQIEKETLETLADDLKHFLEEKEQEGKEEREKGKVKEKAEGGWGEGIITDIINLFRGKGKEGAKAKEEAKKKPKEKKRPDNWAESVLRAIAARDMEETIFKVYDTYKKAHGMPGYPSPYEEPSLLRSKPK
ncbi:MAG: hypothetical protein QXS07_00090 [Candidatus Pacearchaeota archaeon]